MLGLAPHSQISRFSLITKLFCYNPKPRLSRSFTASKISMVEGHQCHRIAHAHRKSLVGKAFTASSPNGRFTEGAAAITGKMLHRIEVHGKNLFYFFSNNSNTNTADDASPVILHFHFGMSGTFLSASLPGPAPKPTCRLMLTNTEANIVAQLSAMTVQHGDLNFYNSKKASLGEDPLREDAQKDLVWAKVHASSKPIGLLLMDQSVIAGVGNIYRAEILFKAGLHPEQPGNTLSRSQFDVVWQHSAELLHRGFLSGSILTVDEEEAKVLGQPWTRRYIYNHSSCGRCSTSISTWDMAGRTVYCCTTCQPLQTKSGVFEGEKSLSPARLSAMRASNSAKTFVSHCAPDDTATAGAAFDKLTVAALKERLHKLGLPVNGKKSQLVARLLEAAQSEVAVVPKSADAMAVVTTPEVVAEGGKKTRRRRPLTSVEDDDSEDAAAVYPEVYNWDHREAATNNTNSIKSAKQAALEKLRAGEGRNVEHVAMQDDETLELQQKVAKRVRK